MKPIVIFKGVNSNGKIELTPEEFKKYVEDAYENGYKDGNKTVTYAPTWTWTWPWTVPTVTYCNDTTAVSTTSSQPVI